MTWEERTVKPKSVREGYEPWEVLHDIVLNRPQMLYFHIGYLVVDVRRWQHQLRDFFRVLYNVPLKNPFAFRGGELLTRCSDKVLLPNEQIGKAFGRMPPEKIAEMFPLLLEAQMQFVKKLPYEENTYYSVNLERVDHRSVAWKDVCRVLRQYGNLPVNLEIKENTMLEKEALQDIAEICTATGMRVYIDDFASKYHELPQCQEYLRMVIDVLYAHIKAIKIDYMIMDKLDRDVELFDHITRNLSHFAYLWCYSTHNYVQLCVRGDAEKPELIPYYQPKTGLPLPWVIFESMPPSNPDELVYLERNLILHHGYEKRGYQIG